MPKYLYLIRNSGEGTGVMSPEDMQQIMEKYLAWVENLKSGNHFVAAEKLVDGTGRVVQKSKGIVRDGPFSESKEVVGGFWIVSARDYGEAVALSEDLPYGDGTLEIREIHEE